MKRFNKHIFALILILLAFGALLYSKSKSIFPHGPHLEMEMECKACHPQINTSKKAKDLNLPQKKSCIGDCHDESIFKNLKFVKSTPKYRIEYNHEIHLDQDIKCDKCHKGLESDKFTPGSAFPKMYLCFECHDNSTAAKTCTLCHSGKVPFPHKTHIDGGMYCDGCHKEIKKSKSTDGAKDIPSKKSCNECHDKKDRYADVTMFPYRQVYLFNHKLHIEDQGLECKDCHGVLYKKNSFKQTEIVPKMDYCFECHDNETASKHCMLCHINPTMPKDHYLDWDNLHKVKASNDLKGCKDCHSGKDFCTKCHKGIIKPLSSHNPNFELTHKYESRTRMKNCKACHSERFCRNCHAAKGVNKRSKVHRNPHPQGFKFNRHSPNFHGRKARLRLSACTACHTKNDCNYCHIKKRR